MTTNVDVESGRAPLGHPGAGPADPPVPRFRFPAADDPSPDTRRLLGMSVYATVLGVGYLGVFVLGLLTLLGGAAPGWYAPVLAVAALLSVGLTVAAYLSVHRRRLPWALLGAAGVPLLADVALALAY